MNKPVTPLILAIILCAGVPSVLHAGQASVVDAQLEPSGGNDYRVTATVRHDDRGWDHYADAFEIVGPDGNVLGRRELAHPHVDEQPFTRSLSRVAIPPEIRKITVRAHDKVHGYGSRTVTLDVPR